MIARAYPFTSALSSTDEAGSASKTLICKLRRRSRQGAPARVPRGRFLDVPRIAAQTLHLADQGGIFLLDNLNLAHQTLKIVAAYATWPAAHDHPRP